MKKALSIILVLAMFCALFSLAACKKEEAAADPAAPSGGETTTPPASDAGAAGGETAGAELTVDQLKASKPNEYVQEKLDAGLEPLVFFGAPLLTDSFVVMIKDGIGAELEALGFSYASGDCEGNMAMMIDMVENAVTMQASGVIVMAFVEGLGDVCAQAHEAGTSVIVFGAVPEFTVDGMVVLDQYTQGLEATKMISAWLDAVYPNAAAGSVKCMMTNSVGNDDNIARSNGYAEGIAAEKRLDLVYTATETDLSTDEGFNYCEEGFTLNPDIRVVLTFSVSAAIGANNFICSRYPDQLAEFGVFCNSQEQSLLELIAKSETNDGSCIRGTIAQGGDVPFAMVVECTKDVLLGGAEFGYVKNDRTYAVNSFGYVYDSEA